MDAGSLTASSSRSLSSYSASSSSSSTVAADASVAPWHPHSRSRSLLAVTPAITTAMASVDADGSDEIIASVWIPAVAEQNYQTALLFAATWAGGLFGSRNQSTSHILLLLLLPLLLLLLRGNH